MPAISLTTFISRFRSLGGYNNSRTITDTLITEWVNDAIGEYSDLLDKQHEGYRDTRTTIVTVAGTATVALPATAHKIKAVDILEGGEYQPLRRLTIRQTYGFSSQDIPRGYMHVGADLELFPTPNAVYTLRLRYTPTSTVLAIGADTITVPNGWEMFILQTALLAADEKQERSTVERLNRIAKERQRIIDAAESRNQAEPEYLVPHETMGDYL